MVVIYGIVFFLLFRGCCIIFVCVIVVMFGRGFCVVVFWLLCDFNLVVVGLLFGSGVVDLGLLNGCCAMVVWLLFGCSVVVMWLWCGCPQPFPFSPSSPIIGFNQSTKRITDNSIK